MTRSTQYVTKAGQQSADDPMTFILSDETVDRVGDVIRASGWDLRNFKKNPVALFGHDHSFPIGEWKNVRVVGKQLLGTLKLASEGTSARIDEIRSLLEQRILKAVSVGFSIKDYEPMDKSEPYGGWDIKKAELHETSVVSVPANPSAVLLAKSMGISSETRSIVFGAGKSATLIEPASQAKSATVAPRDYSDLLGDPSDVVRARNRLKRLGQI
jgi:HK97 family phage prohead protease